MRRNLRFPVCQICDFAYSIFVTGNSALTQKQVVRHLGPVMPHELSEAKVRDYQRARPAEGVDGRTVNMELGELSRALSPDEEQRLLEASRTQTSPNRFRTPVTFIGPALLTGMRSGEIASFPWP